MNIRPCRGRGLPEPRSRIVAMAPNPWDGPWMNRHQLLSRLASRHAIIYTQGLFHTSELWSERWRDSPFGGRIAQRNGLWVDRPPRWLLRNFRSTTLDGTARRLGARRWTGALKHWRNHPLVAYVFHPMFWPYVDALQPAFLVYHAYDLFCRMPSWEQADADDERALLRRADLSLASSEMTAAVLTARGGRPVRVLPNAVDYNAFAHPQPLPGHLQAELDAIPHPRIGYIGRLSMKVDLPLIAALAARHRDWQFVLIGGMAPLDAYTRAGLANCRQLKNVILLGHRHPQTLPGYARAMDVNALFYRLDGATWADACDPLKLYEYLAAGQPVVGSAIPGLKAFSDVVWLVRSLEDWQRALHGSLAGNGAGTSEQRLAVAHRNDWWNRVDTLNGLLNDMFMAPRQL
ncbi:MAG: glycosyltransferase [Aquisalimonadaceae bacterium]